MKNKPSILGEFTYGILTFLSLFPLAYICLVIFYEYLIDSGVGTYLSWSAYGWFSTYQLYWVYGIIPAVIILELILMFYIPKYWSKSRKYPMMLLALNLLLVLLYWPMQGLI